MTIETEVVTFRGVAKPEPPEIAGIEQSLVTDVVQREQAACILKERLVTSTRTLLSHGKATGPIVSVYDVGFETQVLQ